MLNGDEFRDGQHDVLLGDIYIVEGKLASKTPLFRIANTKNDGTVDEDYCQPVNDDPPPATGTTSIEIIGRIMSLPWAGEFHGRYYPVVRGGQPTAVQFSVDAGMSWGWVSEQLPTK